MYGLVKKNDGTYALSEIYHYGKGHLDGGHSGRYPWGSGAKNGKDVATSDVRKYKNVRFRNGSKGEEYKYTIGDIKTRNGLLTSSLIATGASIGITSGGPLGLLTGGSIGSMVGGGFAGIKAGIDFRTAQKRKAQMIDDFNAVVGSFVDQNLSDPRGYENLVKDAKVFISGSSKTQDPSSPFYQKELPKAVRNMIDHCVINDSKILVGDAPGVDSQVQDYLKDLNYKNVVVYSPFENPRYMSNGKWESKTVPGDLSEKDKAMAKDADTGIAVVIEGGSKATRENVKDLNRQNKTAMVYEISSDPEARRLEKIDLETAPSLYQDRKHDKWINDRIKKENKIQEKVDEVLKNYPGISAKVITK